MQRVLLKKDAIVKSREFGNVRLSSDVEADTLGNKELGAMGSTKRWAGMTEEQRKAHGQMLKEARAKKREGRELSAATEAASPRVSPPAENARKNCMVAPETPENLHETCDNSAIDWTKTDFQIAQATGKSVPAVKKLREQQVKP